MPPRADRRTRDNSPETFKPSESVEEAWLVYAALGGTETVQLRDHAKEVVKVVTDFGKNLVESSLEVAQLAPMIQLLSSEDRKERQAAWLALNQYSSKNPENTEYIRALSRDLGIEIPQFLDTHYEARTENDLGKFDSVPLLDVLGLMSDKPSSLVKDPRGVNIESSLIGAALTYTTLKRERKTPGSLSEDELFENMFAAEAAYQRLMEVIGYDGLVMAMKDEVDLIRVRIRGGEYDGITEENLEVVRKMFAEMPSAEEMRSVTDSLIIKLTNKDARSELVLDDSSGHGIQFGSGRILESYIDDDEIDEDTMPTFNAIRYVWRRKSLTSAARKVTKRMVTGADGKETEVVMPISDLYGVTLIYPSIEALAYDYRNMAGILQDLSPSQLELATSRNKDTAFHAKADKDDNTVQAIEIDLGNLGARLDKKISDNGHKVIKLTLRYSPKGTKVPLSFEIQFQTEEDRANSRTGTAAHVNKDQDYKTDPEVVQITKELSELPKRRERTDSAGLTQHSIDGGNKLFPRITPDQETQKALGAVAIDVIRPEN